MTAPLRPRAPLPPARRWLLRGMLLAAVVLAPYLVTYQQPAPKLGETLGDLQPCPQTPNCVCTDFRYEIADNAARLAGRERPERPPHYVPPIELPDDSGPAWEKLKSIVEKQPGIKVIQSTDRYLHVERRSTIYGLIDDVELVRLFSGTVLIRSAARIAYADFHRNRRFIERIRTEFDRQPAN